MANKTKKSIQLENMVTGVVSAVADAQYEMDKNSINTSLQLAESGLSGKLGLKARWYSIPEAELDLKLLLQISEERELEAHLLNGDYSSRYNMDGKVSSAFNMKVKRVPIEANPNLSVFTEKEIIDRISKLRKVAQVMHLNNGSFISADFEPLGNGESYEGGNWNIELVRPADAESEEEQKVGLLLSAYFLIDDETGEVLIAKYFDDVSI